VADMGRTASASWERLKKKTKNNKSFWIVVEHLERAMVGIITLIT
jgi:hypothetical protein